MAQFDWKVLRAKVNTYAPGTTAQTIYADVTAKTLAGPFVDVAASSVVGFLMLSGAYLPLAAFAQGAVSGNATHDTALAAAKMLMALITTPNAPAFNTANAINRASITGMMDAILSQETATPGSAGFTQAVHDGLLALSATQQSWAEQNEWTGISLDQISYAQSPAIQDDPTLA